MRYLGQDEVNQMMGIGYLGEVRTGPDGNLYQWVETTDGLGNPVGFWRALRRVGRRLRRFVRRAVPLVQQIAPLIPGGAAVSALRTAAPLLRRAVPIVQQVAPVIPGAAPAAAALTQAIPAAATAAPEETTTAGWGLGQDELTQVMGIGYAGEIAQAPDGNLYQWVEGYDGLGNPIGFWRALRRLRRRVQRGLRRVVGRALPIVQQIAPFVPGVGPAAAAALTAATPILRQAGVAGYNGLGALYQAPDGTLYQMQGLTEGDDLQGLAEDEELGGLSEDEELRGFAEDDELSGLAEDEELTGFAEDDEVSGLGEDEELQGLTEHEDSQGVGGDEELTGLGQGYVRQRGTSGIGAYMPEQSSTTRWFVAPNQTPEIWKPLW
jgi:hypothetical protein